MANPRIPPHNNEAEESVLGAVLIDKDAVVSVAEFLRSEHFYKEANGKIFAAILSLFEKREPIDLVTLTDELKKMKAYKEVGGAAYLTGLASAVPTAANVEYYGWIVHDHFTKRQLISTAGRISELAFGEAGDVKEILDKAEQSLFSISQAHQRQYFVPIKDVLAESFDRLDEIAKKPGGLRGIPTGFRDLDNLLAGMQDSNLLILASRPGIGKTSLSLNIARHVAVKRKLPVGIFSLEMSKEELVDRFLVAQSGVNAWKLKTGRLGEDDFSALSEAMGVLAEAPLFIDDTPGMNILEMRTKARRLQAEKGLKFLIVDYLQLAHSRNLENRVQEISEVSQGFKNLARELRIPVLACSQLSRAVVTRGGKPRLADLRESGALEQDADVVMFIYREDEEKQDQVILNIAKHRNGPTGIITLRFVKELISFFGVERKRKK